MKVRSPCPNGRAHFCEIGRSARRCCPTAGKNAVPELDEDALGQLVTSVFTPRRTA